MELTTPQLSFYIPKPFWLDSIPTEVNWQGFGLGIYAWTLQTYLHLQAAGLPCQLVHQFPETGIVFAHSNNLRGTIPPPPAHSPRLLVCLKAEAPLIPQAHIHVVQNPTEADRHLNCLFLPHWPQPDLLPRDPQRGDRFENLAFLGHQNNLAPELRQPAWMAFLHQHRLQWCTILNRNRWHDYTTLDHRWNDYRHLDAVIAVRTFNHRLLKQSRSYSNKPATKLYNAWLAGVPAILGVESAYRAERQSPLDYLEVTSIAELYQAVQRLQGDRGLRQAMVENGRHRAQAVTSAQICSQWIALIQHQIIPAYHRWCEDSRWQRQWRSHYHSWNILWHKAQHKTPSLIGFG